MRKNLSRNQFVPLVTLAKTGCVALMMRQYQANYWVSEEKLRNNQLETLRVLVDCASQSSKSYTTIYPKEVGPNPGKIRNSRELERFIKVTKADHIITNKVM